MNTTTLNNRIAAGSLFGVTALFLSLTGVVHAQTNLVMNGDFSAGNTGFSTDYTQATGNSTSPGQYGITINPALSYPVDGFSSYGDHTSGLGNMMLVDGSATATSRAWYETLTLAANTNYNFSYWVASADSSSPATLTFSAAANQIGSAFSVSATPGVFQDVTGTFNSGAGGSVVVAIRDTNTGAAGNDFTLDDIKITAGSASSPEPGSLVLVLSSALTVAGGVCARRRRI